MAVQVSSTYHLQNSGLVDYKVLRALSLTSSITRLSIDTDTGDPWLFLASVDSTLVENGDMWHSNTAPMVA